MHMTYFEMYLFLSLYFKQSEINADEIYGLLLKAMSKGNFIALYPYVRQEESHKPMTKIFMLNEKKQTKPKIKRRKETVTNEQTENTF